VIHMNSSSSVNMRRIFIGQQSYSHRISIRE
jgi:hypothetical protein